MKTVWLSGGVVATLILGLFLTGCTADFLGLPEKTEEEQWTEDVISDQGDTTATYSPEGISYQTIRKGQTKSWWITGAGRLTVYYYPNGNSPSRAYWWISAWPIWQSSAYPSITIDIYVSSGLPGKGWYWMYRSQLKPWRRSLPLWLGRAIYKFVITPEPSTSLEPGYPARVTLRIR